MIRAWRIVKATRAASAFDGEGARLYGGRWNSVGTPAVYAAQSESLAALEMLVHLQSSHLLMSYSSIPVDFGETLVEPVEPAEVSPNWMDYPAPSALQHFGDRWAAEQRSVVLQVRSVVVPTESIYVLNPRHPAFRELKIGAARTFRFDPRLK